MSNSVQQFFYKLWLDDKHSTIDRYFALWLIVTDVFQMPQLHKNFNVVGAFDSPP